MIAVSNGTAYILRLEGDCTMAAAAELKAALIQGLAAARDLGKDLCVDLGGAGEIDITTLQLLWAAEQAAASEKRGLVSQVPEALRALAHDAGFQGFPGEAAKSFPEAAKGPLEAAEG